MHELGKNTLGSIFSHPLTSLRTKCKQLMNLLAFSPMFCRENKYLHQNNSNDSLISHSKLRKGANQLNNIAQYKDHCVIRCVILRLGRHFQPWRQTDLI
ncbi:hypothetical protein FGO68_gene9199 [Halteria grandinella]|uniref:Uncharacterized protein n=1 Tax=Halteria grandinella TaxID=5974 RepID=A0A8J8P5U1_HALGN|nr:hypothetical protein FGO68_gene9199 [Halteria grandinella]